MLLPIKSFTYRLSSFKAPWFDGECVTSKRTLRKLERSYRSFPSSSFHVLWLSHLSTYRSLLHSKHSNFLISSINSASSSSSRWKNLNRILSKQSPPPPFPSQDFQDYFHNKILSIRTNRSSHTPPAPSPASVSLSHFSPITFTDLMSIIKSESSFSCSRDLKDFSFFFFYRIILKLINLSLATSKFPTSFKSSIVTPILKKPSLDPSIISNYRLFTNLSFLSKILEKAIYLQLSNFLLSNNLLPSTQSGFRPSHSTETCLLKISNDALLASDSGKLSLLLSLGFSSAFDTVNHSLLLQHLNSFFGISGSSLSWLTSYLSNRSSAVSINNSSSPLSVPFDVSQRPLLFILYTSHLPCLIQFFSFQSQFFADDTYIFSSFPLSSLSSILEKLSLCLSFILSWSDSMQLKLNSSKFNFIYLSKPKSLPSSLPPIMISDLTIYPSSTIRCLGFLLNSFFSFNPQILSVAFSCFYHLRRIRQISSYLDDASLKVLVCSLVLSRLDYCNFLYFNLPKSTLYPLIKAFNSAARLVSHTSKFSHISPSLVDLHWLPPHFRFSFEICTLMYKISHSNSPSYLSNLLLPLKRAGLRSSTRSQLFIFSLPLLC